MGTILVAGRVESATKAAADAAINRAGMTNSDVIRIVWDNMARTGQVPRPVEKDDSTDEILGRFQALRARTPRSAFLESLTPRGVKDELAERL